MEKIRSIDKGERRGVIRIESGLVGGCEQLGLSLGPRGIPVFSVRSAFLPVAGVHS
jgi:hypothetical protein